MMSYRILPIFLVLFAFVLSANCQTSANDEKAKPCKYLSFADAEKILGQSVEIVENSWTFTNGKTTFKCNYRRVENDKATGREVNLYFMLEESADEVAAKQIYQGIWDGNKKHKGIEVLSGIGDEAYAHSDKTNFHFVLARKGKFTIRLKINKATATTSFDELKAFAKRVVEDLKA